MTVKMQQRRDTAANWTSNNPTLASGELAYETDTGKIKVGDGTTAWTSLAYFTAGGSGTVTSVDMTVPTGLAVSGSPITASGTLAVTYTAGYSIPTTTKQTQWDTAYGWGDHSIENYAVTTGDTFTGNLTVSAELKADSYNESKGTVTSSSGALTIDCHNGNVFSLALSENVTSTTFSNPPASGTAFAFSLFVTQDSTARTIAWPASVAWPSATAPTLSATSGDVDIFTFTTFDGGTTWYGVVSGQAL